MSDAPLFKDATGKTFPFPVANPDPATGAALAAIKDAVAALPDTLPTGAATEASVQQLHTDLAGLKTAVEAVTTAITGEASTQAAILSGQQALATALGLLETHADAVSASALLTSIRDAAAAAATHTDAGDQLTAIQALASTVATHADVAAEGTTEASILTALQGALTFTLPTGAATEASLQQLHTDMAALKTAVEAVTAAINGEATTQAALLSGQQALATAVGLLDTHADAVSESTLLTSIRDAANAAATHTDATDQLAAIQALASAVATHADAAAEGTTEASILAALQGALTFSLPTGAATSAKQDAAKTALDQLHTDLTGPTPAGEAHLGQVGGHGKPCSASFSRPADTVAYDIGDLIADTTVAGSITPMVFPIARKNGGTGVLVRVRATCTDTALLNKTARLHVFKTKPTSSAGDNAAFAGSVNGLAARHICEVDIVFDRLFSDGVKGVGVVDVGAMAAFDTEDTSPNLYGLFEAQFAGALASGATLSATPESFQD